MTFSTTSITSKATTLILLLLALAGAAHAVSSCRSAGSHRIKMPIALEWMTVMHGAVG